jgi:hypothetical protein
LSKRQKSARCATIPTLSSLKRIINATLKLSNELRRRSAKETSKNIDIERRWRRSLRNRSERSR